ncbi:MAG: hypothetical protein GTO53_02740 [Planctomycetales bacterium]|nr:hypothetical protein [Planctomycetales bacterium]NIM08087.1 hypothetical protein [Planctomycetales bacterium]NIN07578.1 hypothetical protein [Planctomycetales bacterium]NIN76689.1 hypothetical protein [Planctomycetales bacterium]NIO33877.1 hypothetical protein [Planctomycetales bacterium]
MDANGNDKWDPGESYDDAGLDGNDGTQDYGEGNGRWDGPTPLLAYLDGAASPLWCPGNVEPGTVSYGMHHKVHRMQSGDSRKIVMLDYFKPEVKVVELNVAAQDDWDSPQAKKAVRHRGRLNVLYYDGTVETRDPADIKPSLCQPFKDYWRPFRDSTELAGCS